MTRRKHAQAKHGSNAYPSFALKNGESLGRPANSPVIELIDFPGAAPYLWIGNDAPTDKMCFATMEHAPELKKLAYAILGAFRHPKYR